MRPSPLTSIVVPRAANVAASGFSSTPAPPAVSPWSTAVPITFWFTFARHARTISRSRTIVVAGFDDGAPFASRPV